MPGSDCSVRVAVRVRPLSAKEHSERARPCLRSVQPRQLVIGSTHAFTYDHVLLEGADQDAVYDTCVGSLVKKFLQGFNATILAYGQTGSGKTFTMGTQSSRDVTHITRGIVPRVVEAVFASVAARRGRDANTTVDLRVQFLEIYNDAINDLLNPAARSSELQIRETKEGGIYVLGAREEYVRSPAEMLACLDRGTMCRVTGSTNMNATSSRSHAIFSIVLTQRTPLDVEGDAGDALREDVVRSKFHFVDLAGSERLKRTGAVGDRMREGININKGLLALGNVISALGDEKRKGCHVPFRDSKITRILQDSLGGNSQTLMIACVSPSDTNFDETLNTLKYANRARNIKNKPVINRDPMAVKIESLTRRVRELERALVAAGGDAMGSAAVSAGAYEDVTNQLLDAECEIKRLVSRQSAMQTVVASLQKRLADSNAQHEATIAALRTSSQRLRDNGLDVSAAEVRALDSGAAYSATAVQQRLQQQQQASDGLVAPWMASPGPSASVGPITSTSDETKRRGVSLTFSQTELPLGSGSGPGGSVDEVNVVTPYGNGQLLSSRNDGMISVALSFGVCHIQERVSTPYGPGRVFARREDGIWSVALSAFSAHAHILSDLCASDMVVEDDDDAFDIDEEEQARLQNLEDLTYAVQTLDDDIERKQLLMKKLIDTQRKARVVEADFKSRIFALEGEVSKIKEQRDRALREMNKQEDTGDERRSVLVSKYQRKLKILTDEMGKLRRKYAENQRLLRSKTKAAEKLHRLQNEVVVQKRRRIELQKRMREAEKAHQAWAGSKTRQVKQLVREKNKARLKVSKLESKIHKQALIIRRREGENAALHRKLKSAKKQRTDAKRRTQRRKARAAARERAAKTARSRREKSRPTTMGSAASKRYRTTHTSPGQPAPSPSPHALAKAVAGLEQELTEAARKFEVQSELRSVGARRKATIAARKENRALLARLEPGSAAHSDAADTEDTLRARQLMLERKIIRLRTDLARWSIPETPGNLTENLFFRLPALSAGQTNEMVLQLMHKIVRQEIRSRAQNRKLDRIQTSMLEAEATRANPRRGVHGSAEVVTRSDGPNTWRDQKRVMAAQMGGRVYGDDRHGVTQPAIIHHSIFKTHSKTTSKQLRRPNTTIAHTSTAPLSSPVVDVVSATTRAGADVSIASLQTIQSTEPATPDVPRSADPSADPSAAPSAAPARSHMSIGLAMALSRSRALSKTISKTLNAGKPKSEAAAQAKERSQKAKEDEAAAAAKQSPGPVKVNNWVVSGGQSARAAFLIFYIYNFSLRFWIVVVWYFLVCRWILRRSGKTLVETIKKRSFAIFHSTAKRVVKVLNKTQAPRAEEQNAIPIIVLRRLVTTQAAVGKKY